MPTVCSARIADSRPEPGPLTRTSSERMPTALAALPALSAACVAANGVPLRDPLNPIPPALDQATTLPSVSVIVTTVLLNDAWMCASPWWTMRFSPRFLKVFLRFPAAPSFFSFSGVAPSGAAAASVLAIYVPRQLHGLLLVGNRALARALARARVGPRALAAHRQTPAVPYPPVAPDFHQALDVHGDVLAEIAFHSSLLFYDAADLPDVVLRQILHAEVGTDPCVLEDLVRTDAPDAENVRQTDLHALRAGEINASDSCHKSEPRNSAFSSQLLALSLHPSTLSLFV